MTDFPASKQSAIVAEFDRMLSPANADKQTRLDDTVKTLVARLSISQALDAGALDGLYKVAEAVENARARAIIGSLTKTELGAILARLGDDTAGPALSGTEIAHIVEGFGGRLFHAVKTALSTEEQKVIEDAAEAFAKAMERIGGEKGPQVAMNLKGPDREALLILYQRFGEYMIARARVVPPAASEPPTDSQESPPTDSQESPPSE